MVENIFKICLMPKVNAGGYFRSKRLLSTTHYYKKYGIMCCIVLKTYYLCDVIGDKPVKSCHEFLKYSKVLVLFSTTSRKGQKARLRV